MGAGACGRGVAVGAAAARVGVGLGGGATEPPPDGMMRLVPMLISVPDRPLACIRACTVMSNLLAMPLSVSPA